MNDGVLMVGPNSIAVAIRGGDGKIETAVENFQMPLGRFRNVPLLRGILAILGAVVLAIKSARLEQRLLRGKRSKRRQMLMTFAPMIASSLIERAIGAILISRRRHNDRSVRPSLFTVFMPLLAFRISGLFSPGSELLKYHAAEHMAVNSLEAGQPVRPEIAGLQSRIHPRCGTTFAFWALLLGWLASKQRQAGKVRALLAGPVVVSVAYELVRFGAANRDKQWVKAVYAPAWQAQHLTTSPASQEHLEVACAALTQVMAPESEENPSGMV